MNNRTLVKNLAALPDGPVTVAGWVETVRDQKKVQFVILRDESGAVQLVNPATRELDPRRRRRRRRRLAITETISALAHGSFITVTGELKHDERVKLGGLEVKIGSLDVVAEANPETPIAADSSLDKRMDWRFLDLRHPKQNLIFRIQTTFLHALRTYWVEHDFVEIHTPKLMASALGVARRALRGRLLRGQGVPRAEPAVLQADGAAGRLRQGVRGRTRVPRRPVVHRRGTPPSSPRSTPR